MRITYIKGGIKKTREYKYLGVWFIENNNMYRQIREMDGKIEQNLLKYRTCYMRKSYYQQ